MPASLPYNLPWQALQQQSNAFGDFQNPSSIGPAYAGAYNAALNLNAGLGQTVNTNYETLRGQLDQQYGDISKGYSDLMGDVLGRISGTNQTNIQDINTAYNAQAGSQLQNAISRGLGNSTVQQNMQRGVELDRQRAITGSQNQFAQLGAGYASALGQAGLGARQQGAQIGANLGSQQLGFQASTMAPYPNASLYANLAQMAGANQQRTQAQGQFDQLARPGGAGFSQGGMGVGGGRADNTPFKGPTMMDHGGGMVGGYGGGGFGNFGGFAGGSAPAPYQPPPEWGFSGGAFDPGSEFNPSQGGLGVPEAPWQGSGEGNLSSDPYSGAMSGEGLYDYQTPFYG